MNDLTKGVLPLAKQIAALQNQMRALGMFPNDRELLECPGCGLMENVTHDGVLITCREPDLDKDTGLRFEPLTEAGFRCPGCGETVHEPLPEDERNNGLPS